MIATIVAPLLTAPLNGSVDTFAGRTIQALPKLAIRVAACVVTIGVAWLLTLLGRKIRPLFRTRSTKLRDLASEIRELRGYENPTGPDALPLVSDYRLRRDDLIAEAAQRDQFHRLSIPVVSAVGRVRWTLPCYEGWADIIAATAAPNLHSAQTADPVLPIPALPWWCRAQRQVASTVCVRPGIGGAEAPSYPAGWSWLPVVDE